MRAALALLVAALAGPALAQSVPAPAPKVTITRLACGDIQANDLDYFSDTRAYVGKSKPLVASCYLIRHGSDLLLWDTGLPLVLKGKAPSGKRPLDPTLKETLVDELARLGVTPDQIGRVGISHYHFDHTGQAASFPHATLLIGSGDWAALSATPHDPRADPAPLAPWTQGGGKVEQAMGDKDVFGDGTVTMLATPGHTPGHHALLVKLQKTGWVILAGDVAHFHENYDADGLPFFNTDRAQSLASMSRIKQLARNLHALVVLQHDPADIATLPSYPAAAE